MLGDAGVALVVAVAPTLAGTQGHQGAAVRAAKQLTMGVVSILGNLAAFARLPKTIQEVVRWSSAVEWSEPTCKRRLGSTDLLERVSFAGQRLRLSSGAARVAYRARICKNHI